jgi:hypothetical protein
MFDSNSKGNIPDVIPTLDEDINQIPAGVLTT